MLDDGPRDSFPYPHEKPSVSLGDSEDLSDACMGMDFMRDDALSAMPGML